MTEAALTCERHPDQETSLRCNRCGKPICSQCAVQTPVGYRCQDCVRGQQKIFDTVKTIDYPIAFVLSAFGVALAVGALSFVGFWGFFVAPLAGGALAEAVRWAVRRRRSRRLPLAAAIGGAVGMLPRVFIPLLALGLSLLDGAGVAVMGQLGLAILFPLIQGGIMIAALYYRLRGIRL